MASSTAAAASPSRPLTIEQVEELNEKLVNIKIVADEEKQPQVTIPSELLNRIFRYATIEATNQYEVLREQYKALNSTRNRPCAEPDDDNLIAHAKLLESNLAQQQTPKANGRRLVSPAEERYIQAWRRTATWSILLGEITKAVDGGSEETSADRTAAILESVAETFAGDNERRAIPRNAEDFTADTKTPL